MLVVLGDCFMVSNNPVWSGSRSDMEGLLLARWRREYWGLALEAVNCTMRDKTNYLGCYSSKIALKAELSANMCEEHVECYSNLVTITQKLFSIHFSKNLPKYDLVITTLVSSKSEILLGRNCQPMVSTENGE